MRAIVLGAPGAGKGTQADFVCERYGVPKIATGDMLRAAAVSGSELGRRAKEIMDVGALVPDEIILGLVEERLSRPDCGRGFLFDGFPRNIPQAEALHNRGITVDVVVEIAVDDSEIVRRVSGRRIHPASGRTYHVEFNPPARPGKDDLTGEELVQREDDRESTVRERLRVYHDQTRPLIDYYSKWERSGDRYAPHYVRIDGMSTLDSVRSAVLEALDQVVSSLRATSSSS